MASAIPNGPGERKRLSRFSLIGICFVVALLPVVVWLQIRSAQLSALQNAPSDADLLTPGFRNDPRHVLFWDDHPATEEIVTPAFTEIMSQLDADLVHIQPDDIERTETKLCEADPHLAKALSDLQATPLAGPNPRVQTHVNADNTMIIPLFIDDYRANSKDSAELQGKLIPAITSALDDFLRVQVCRSCQQIGEASSPAFSR